MKDVFEYIRDELKPVDSPAWEKYKTDMETFIKELKPYFTPDDQKRYQPISINEYKRIEKVFDNVAKSSNEFMKTYAKVKEKTVDENGKPVLTIKEVMKNLNDEFFAKGYVEYKNITPKNQFSLKDQMETFRYTDVQITSDEVKRLGGNQSSRLQMKVDIDGKDVKGVFTEKTYFTGEKDLAAFFAPLGEKYPKYANFFNGVNNKNFFSEKAYFNAGIEKLLSEEGKMHIDKRAKAGAVNDYLKGLHLNDETAALATRLVNDEGFYEALVDFAAQIDTVRIAASINVRAIGLKAGDRIDSRNNAMSAVATLIKCPDLIAKSRPLVIFDDQGRKFKEGTFMEFARGKDINNLAPVDEMRLLGPDDYESPEVKRQLANLQILDYICGNVDRHGGNILYDIDAKTKKLVGVVGIDNDSAFGKKEPNVNGAILRLPGINNLRVIDEDMANTISNLSEGELKATLHGYGLDDAAIEAAWKRTTHLQKAIINGDYYEDTNGLPNSRKNRPYLTIMKKQDWKDVDLEEVGRGTGNYFYTVKAISKYPTKKDKISQFTERRKVAAYTGLVTAMSKGQTGFLYDKAKSASPWFFASTRYKNILSKLKEYHDTKFTVDEPLNESNQKKFDKLDELNSAIEVYKREKVRDGFIDENWNIKRDVTGKDLDRILLVKDMKTYVDRINKEKERTQEIRADYKQKKLETAKVNEFLARGYSEKEKLVNLKLQKEEEQKAKEEVLVNVSNKISVNINASIPEVEKDNNIIKKADVDEPKEEKVVEKKDNVVIKESDLEI